MLKYILYLFMFKFVSLSIISTISEQFVNFNDQEYFNFLFIGTKYMFFCNSYLVYTCKIIIKKLSLLDGKTQFIN